MEYRHLSGNVFVHFHLWNWKTPTDHKPLQYMEKRYFCDHFSHFCDNSVISTESESDCGYKLPVPIYDGTECSLTPSGYLSTHGKLPSTYHKRLPHMEKW